MPTEQRIIANKPKIGAKPTIGGSPAASVEEAAAPPKGRRKLVVVLLAVLVLGGGAGWYFLMGPGAGSAEDAAAAVPEPGEVLVVEPISLNLADGHYLRLGMGLQMSKDAGGHGEPTTAPALDHAIALFSGRPMAEVASPEGREALKTELLHQLEEAYHGDVIDVYFTEYVTQ